MFTFMRSLKVMQPSKSEIDLKTSQFYVGFQIDFYFLNLFRLHSTLLHFLIPGFNPMEPSVKSIV